MKTNVITAAVAALLVGVLPPVTATASEVLSREATGDVFTGATGTHYHQGKEKWYAMKWMPDGKVEMFEVNAKPDDDPVDAGKWRIKEVTPMKDESAESVAARNAALRFVYCHQFEAMFNGHDLCWEVEQETFHKVPGDDKALLPTQTYKLNREAGAESGEYVITRR